MLPMGPSVGNSYRGWRGDTTRGIHTSSNTFWDPLVRDYGPVNVFNEEEIDTTTAKVAQDIRSPASRSLGTRYRDKHNNNNENNNNEDQRNDDPRRNNNKSNQELSRQQRGS